MKRGRLKLVWRPNGTLPGDYVEEEEVVDVVERMRRNIGPDMLDVDDQVALVPRWEVEEAAAEIERLRGARRELVVALHTLASHFENSLYAFRDDDEGRKKAESDIAWAMEIASRHNYNGNWRRGVRKYPIR